MKDSQTVRYYHSVQHKFTLEPPVRCLQIVRLKAQASPYIERHDSLHTNNVNDYDRE
jgi:hypothetical protein